MGVWIMSGWCLRVSWEASIPNQEYICTYLVMMLRYCLFFQCPILQKKCLCLGVSELYLGVSAWGLRVSGDELMQNILAQIYVGHVSLDIAFYSSAR